MRQRLIVVASCVLAMGGSMAGAQEFAPPDRGEPGDEMIQAYLARVTDEIHERYLENVESLEDWETARARYQEEYFYMLGLWPLPEKTPLKATVTGTLEGDGFVIDMIHYQSRSRLYVTGNLYRPAKMQENQRLPAVFYVCGHSGMGRNGNKTAYQSHGIWFARHGYVCLVVDSLQLGEIGALHHGTYREGRWWWHSRGYTPAGVECWNGVRGIDYLLSRPDVDPQRIAVTGISGGGAATFWVAAADERARVAVPVSGMADLPSYVPNRVINGHCDCMFLYNTFQWPWTRIAGLIAPRAMLFVNSDQDRIFPMDANERVINRLEGLYRLYGKGDFVDTVVSVGGHAYRQDIRQAVYRFINTHLKNDPRVVTDSEVDLITGKRPNREFPIELEKLRAFPTDADIPKDELNTTIDEHFVPLAQVEPPGEGQFESWRSELEAELRRVTFRWFPERIPPAGLIGEEPSAARLETEPGMSFDAAPIRKPASLPDTGDQIGRILMIVDGEGNGTVPDWVRRMKEPEDAIYVFAPRGVGPTRWTRKDPPNYVERSHVLLGRTVDAGRIRDVIAVARFLRSKQEGNTPLHLLGEGRAALLAAYAAVLEPEIDAVALHAPPLAHMDPDAPPLLNVLRVCDVPDALGMIAPRPLTIHGRAPDALAKTAAIYAAAGVPDRFVVQED